MIQNFHSDFKFIATSPPHQEDTIFCLPRHIRGHGGVALGWRSTLDKFICLLTQTTWYPPLPSPLLSLLNTVYLPSQLGCTDGFKESLDQLDATLQILPPAADVIVMGDFNADIGATGGPKASTSANEQRKILQKYLLRWNLVSSYLYLSTTADSFIIFHY